jgi:hypothetical protein
MGHTYYAAKFGNFPERDFAGHRKGVRQDRNGLFPVRKRNEFRC